MNCTLCHLAPSRPGTDRCPRCSGIYLIRLTSQARKAMQDMIKGHPDVSPSDIISACIVIQAKVEAEAAAERAGG